MGRRYININIDTIVNNGGDTIFVPVPLKCIVRNAVAICSDAPAGTETILIQHYDGTDTTTVGTVTMADTAGVPSSFARNATAASADKVFDPDSALTTEAALQLVVGSLGAAYTTGLMIEIDEYTLAGNEASGAPTRP